jgi:CubicO group peptidase (beta-lactamase class C family)
MFGRASLVVIAVLVGGSAGAQAASSPADPAFRLVDSIFAGYKATGPGCAVGVMRGGRLVFQRGYGAADVEHGAEITPRTAFYLASLSKQFTAMAIVLLSQDKKLSLDDSVRRWVPEVPALGYTITIRDLLSHTSGLRDYFTLLGIQGWPADGTLTQRQFLDLVSRQRGLNFPPGERFLYSNTGYALLAVVVERVARTTLRDFAASRIFAPLGMSNTIFRDDHQMVIPNRALGYEATGSRLRLSVPQIDVVGDGGVYSTIEDLAKWDANFDTGVVGGKDGVELLQTSGVLSNGMITGYGLGLTLGQFAGTRTVFMSGSYAGYRSTYLRFPEQQLAVTTLCNTTAASATTAELVATVFLPPVPQAPGPAGEPERARLIPAGTGSPVDWLGRDYVPLPDEQAWLDGRYFSDELNMTVSLKARGDALILYRTSGDSVRFTRSMLDNYTLSAEQMTLRVTRDKSGSVTGFTWSTARVRDLVFTRVPFQIHE